MGYGFKIDISVYRTVAEEDYVGKCHIWCDTFFNEGVCGGEAPHYIRDDNTQCPLEFDSCASAQKYIDEELVIDGPYMLGYGEYARPTYTVVKC